MVLDFLAVLDEVESCADLRAVILTGAGRAFCAGFDLRGYADDERLAAQGRIRGLLSRQEEIAGLPVRLHELAVPVIAAVNGPAAGAGSRSPPRATSASRPTARSSPPPRRSRSA